MQGIYPEVGIRGSVEMDAPYDKVIVPGIEYTCIAVESIPGLLLGNTPVYAAYYAKYGGAAEAYERDVATHNKIVAFRAREGDIISVPNSYIRSLPNANGVPYQTLMLGLALSAVPDTQDLKPVIEEIRQLILARIGVESTPNLVTYGPSILLTADKHRAMQSFRNDKAKNKYSYLLQYERAVEENRELQARIDMLEKFILANTFSPLPG